MLLRLLEEVEDERLVEPELDDLTLGVLRDGLLERTAGLLELELLLGALTRGLLRLVGALFTEGADDLRVLGGACFTWGARRFDGCLTSFLG